jgi:hypothetical protein
MKKYNGKELYKGLLFIKSMMSMNNVNRQKELDQTYALSVGIECEQTVVEMEHLHRLTDLRCVSWWKFLRLQITRCLS